MFCDNMSNRQDFSRHSHQGRRHWPVISCLLCDVFNIIFVPICESEIVLVMYEWLGENIDARKYLHGSTEEKNNFDLYCFFCSDSTISFIYKECAMYEMSIIQEHFQMNQF